MVRFTCCRTLFLLSVLLVSISCTTAAPAGSLITHLPGFNGTIPSPHHGGYVTIDGKFGKKNLYYYFVTSERNPSKDPVVLWLNGGPGCSSFDGFVYAHGPFNFVSGNRPGSMPTLHLNPYSWSKVSNIMYLDSPCGVGLSYSDDQRNYNTGDLQTAADTHDFLLKWFNLYPEFLANPFYIAGESYAGVYVPSLAQEVVKGIKKGQKPRINFKGYMIGNGLTDENFDGNSQVPFAYGMGLISNAIFEACFTTCKGIYYDPVSESCEKSIIRAAQAIAGINFYNILEPCYHGSTSKSNSRTKRTKMPLSLPLQRAVYGNAWVSATEDTDPSAESEPASSRVPCIDVEAATAWLNDEAVRQAIHAEKASVAGPWVVCTDRLNYSVDIDSLIPYHINLTSEGYRALIYSGDHDLVIPFSGTEAWTESLGYKIIDEWRSWMSEDQVAGFLQGYEKNFTFITIKGAGHMVPQYKPKEALKFYSSWLEGKAI